jgi:acetyl-CoA acetyltransferase family protein
MARLALLMAGYPEETPGITLNRLCSSGMSGVLWAHQAIRAGEGDLYIVGGVESMSRAPMACLKENLSKALWEDTTFGWRFTNPRYAEHYPPYSMAETAENTVKALHITREVQDRFTLKSHQKAAAAQQSGRFAREILPIPILKNGKSLLLKEDELIRPGLTEKVLRKLPVLSKKHDESSENTITAGNSAPFADGGAVLLLCSERILETYGLTPLARIVSGAVGAGNPTESGVGLVAAIQKLFKKPHVPLPLEAMACLELHESFACQVIANAQSLGIPLERINPNGGGLALGHPLGASGARIVGTLAHQLSTLPTNSYGCAAISVGLGQGEAVLLEAL